MPGLIISAAGILDLEPQLQPEDDRGAHSKAKEFILGIYVCCLCFLKLVNLDLDLQLGQVKSGAALRGNAKAARSVNQRGLPGGGGLWHRP